MARQSSSLTMAIKTLWPRPVPIFILILISTQLPPMSLSTSETLLQLLTPFFNHFIYSMLFHLSGTLFLKLQLLDQCHLPEKYSVCSQSTVDSSLATQYVLPQNSAISPPSINHSFHSYIDICLFISCHLHCKSQRQDRMRPIRLVSSVKSPNTSQRTVCHITSL